MLEHYFEYPRVLRRLRGGGLGDELDRIAAYLFDNGYRRASAKIYLSRLGRFSGFVSRAARGRPIPQSVIDSFVTERPTEASRVAAQTAVALARRIVPQRFEPRGELFRLSARGARPGSKDAGGSAARRPSHAGVVGSSPRR